MIICEFMLSQSKGCKPGAFEAKPKHNKVANSALITKVSAPSRSALQERKKAKVNSLGLANLIDLQVCQMNPEQRAISLFPQAKQEKKVHFSPFPGRPMGKKEPTNRGKESIFEALQAGALLRSLLILKLLCSIHQMVRQFQYMIEEELKEPAHTYRQEMLCHLRPLSVGAEASKSNRQTRGAGFILLLFQVAGKRQSRQDQPQDQDHGSVSSTFRREGIR